MVVEIVWLFQQLDFLDLRLNSLDSVIDKWILVEYPFGYDRKERPLLYENNKEKFKNFEHKIIHVIDDAPYAGISGLGLLWSRKESLKVKQALEQAECKPNDFLIVSDEDAILTKEAIEFADKSRVIGFRIPWFLYYFNCVTPDAVYAWTQSAPYKYYGNNLVVKEPSENAVLLGFNEIGSEAGYHFAKCGGVEAVIANTKAYPHQEFASPPMLDKTLVQERIDNCYGWTDQSKGTAGKDWLWLVDPVDLKKYPEYLRNNPEIFKKYFRFDHGVEDIMNIEGWE